MAGDCRPHHRYPSFFSVSTRRQAAEYLEILSKHDSVYFGQTFFHFQQRLADELKEAWLARRRAPSSCDPSKARVSKFVASGLSDATTSRGIGLSPKPTVLLDTDRGILCYLRPGMRLRFARSGDRIIARIAGDVIELEGQSLDGKKDGYPHPIFLVKE
jgi:hypothetical protein